MSLVLIGLLKANLAASALILLVLLVRKPVRRLFGARIAYGLWALPLLAALAILLPSRTLDAAPLQTVVHVPTPTTVLDIAFLAATAPERAPFDPWLIGGLVWAAGAVFSLALIARGQARFQHEVRRGRAGPALIGFIRPRIVVPADFEARFEPQERAVVIAHEHAHLQRQDSRVVAAAVLLRCLNWFNPLAHLAVNCLRIDQELACDETVIDADPGAACLYAQTMLKAQLAIRPMPLGCYWPTGTQHPLLERLQMIDRERISRTRRLAGASVLTLAAAAAGLAAWAAQPPRMATSAPVIGPPPVLAAAAPAPVQPPAPPEPKAARPAPKVETGADEVCLTNACSETGGVAVAAPAAAAAPAAPAAPPPGFAERFNANAPILLTARVSAVRTEGQNIVFMVQDDAGKAYKVIGGSAERFPPQAVAAAQGAKVRIRGYEGWDTSCRDGCEVGGRDMTFEDGRRVFVGQSGTGAPRDGVDPTER